MQEKKYPITKWAIDDRPREKLLSKSPSALSDSELLAILINKGTRYQSAVDLAIEVFRKGNNNLSDLGRLTVKELMRIHGIGQAKAVTILAALELGRRRQASLPPERTSVTSSYEVAQYLQARLRDHPYEVFGVVFLNQQNQVKQFSIISKGGLTSTVVDSRIIFREALETNAVAMILCHNHPSGSLQPSNADLQLTGRIRDAARLLEIRLLDHLIVSDQGYFSFADNGML